LRFIINGKKLVQASIIHHDVRIHSPWRTFSGSNIIPDVCSQQSFVLSNAWGPGPFYEGLTLNPKPYGGGCNGIHQMIRYTGC